MNKNAIRCRILRTVWILSLFLSFCLLFCLPSKANETFPQEGLVPPFTVLPASENDHVQIGNEIVPFYSSGLGYNVIMPSGDIAQIPGWIRDGTEHPDPGVFLFLPSGTPDVVTVRNDAETDLIFDGAWTVAAGETAELTLTSDHLSVEALNDDRGAGVRWDVQVMRGSGLSSMFIVLDEGWEALRKVNTERINQETGQMKMIAPDGTVRYDGKLLRVNGRGDSSYEMTGQADTKNSYSLKLDSKAELIEGAGKSSKWTILKIRQKLQHQDISGLSFGLAYDALNALSMGWYDTLMTEFIDVYINGEYWGVYVLIERMDQGGAVQMTDIADWILCDEDENPISAVGPFQTGDPAIAAGVNSYRFAKNSYVPEGTDITGGYLLEIEGSHNKCGFKTKRGIFVGIKSPEYPTQEMVSYIATYFQEFEDAVFSPTGLNALGKSYLDYIDADSLAIQTMLYAYYQNWEMYGTSTYICKDMDGSKNEKLTFCPVWDFESNPDVVNSETFFYPGMPSNARKLQQVIMEKGEFVTLMRKWSILAEPVFRLQASGDPNPVIKTAQETIDEIRTSMAMNWKRWTLPDTFEAFGGKWPAALSSRYQNWYGTVWNRETVLTGLILSWERNADQDAFVLSAEPDGNYEKDSIRWYRCLDEDPSRSELIGEGRTIEITEKGKYYCTVSGPTSVNLNRGRDITLVSNIFDFDAPDPDVLEPHEPLSGYLYPADLETIGMSEITEDETENMPGDESLAAETGFPLWAILAISASVVGAIAFAGAYLIKNMNKSIRR